MAFENYDFNNISYFIDELIILNISRKKDINDFIKIVKLISKNCFVPITCGGGIKNLEMADKLLSKCSDKILINSAAYENPEVLKKYQKSLGNNH